MRSKILSFYKNTLYYDLNTTVSVALLMSFLYDVHLDIRNIKYFKRMNYMEHVKVILLQKVAKLGNIGDTVNVKPGFARNYLLPKKIALRATNENKKYFEDKRAQIEAENAKTRSEAQKILDKVKGFSITLIRQASEKGHLYGSVTAKDIASAISAIKENNITVTAGQINLNTPIKEIGLYELSIDLHPEVSVPVKLSVAKSEEEAQQLTAENNNSDLTPEAIEATA